MNSTLSLNIEKTEQEMEEEIELINNMFPDSNFSVAIDIDELDDLITDKQFIIVKNTYNCYCYDNCKKNATYYYIRGTSMTNRYVIEQLIKQGLDLECNHVFLEGFDKCPDSDCQYIICTGS